MTKPRACCGTEVYVVSSEQLPLCCPLFNERLWDAHPRVYLPLELEGKVVCPYCSTCYVLCDTSDESNLNESS